MVLDAVSFDLIRESESNKAPAPTGYFEQQLCCSIQEHSLSFFKVSAKTL